MIDSFSPVTQHSRVGSHRTSANLCRALAIFGMCAAASGRASSTTVPALPPPAKPVEGVAMPVPREIFRALDQFANANWKAVQRPDIASWKSQADQAQIAALLGVVLAEGFIAMEAQDAGAVHKLGDRVLRLARGLGVEQRVLRRSRSIIDHADVGDWAAARAEWDGVLNDIESGMVRLKSGDLAEITSAAGWARGTEALCTLVLQQYSPERAQLVTQPALTRYFEDRLNKLAPRLRRQQLVSSITAAVAKVDRIIAGNEPPSEAKVREIRDVCTQVVDSSSRRPKDH